MPTLTSSTCTYCERTFNIKLSDKNRGRGKFCSRNCHHRWIKGKNNPAYTHGHSRRKARSKEYETWAGIKDRVTNGNELNRKYYKERGITMHKSWADSFEKFLEDVGLAPSKDHSIDRINPNGNYEPGNVRWATRKEQMNNTRSNKLISFNGRTMTQSQWADEIGVNQTAICKRLRRGWSVERALTTPYLR